MFLCESKKKIYEKYALFCMILKNILRILMYTYILMFLDRKLAI